MSVMGPKVPIFPKRVCDTKFPPRCLSSAPPPPYFFPIGDNQDPEDHGENTASPKKQQPTVVVDPVSTLSSVFSHLTVLPPNIPAGKKLDSTSPLSCESPQPTLG